MDAEYRWSFVLLQVFQRRVDATVNFYLNWASYKAGFGDLKENFWLGKLLIPTDFPNFFLSFQDV